VDAKRQDGGNRACVITSTELLQYEFCWRVKYLLSSEFLILS
jgi:hypothetical protein